MASSQTLKHAGNKLKLWLLEVYNKTLVAGIMPKALNFNSHIVHDSEPGEVPSREESYHSINVVRFIGIVQWAQVFGKLGILWVSLGPHVDHRGSGHYMKALAGVSDNWDLNKEVLRATHVTVTKC